jgi:hypothetical protein
MRLARLFRPVLALSVLLASSGCGRFREIATCRALAREVNPALAQIEALSKKPGRETQAQMAKRYAELSKRLEAQASGKTNLAAAVRDYAGVFEATATVLRSSSETASGGSGRPNEPRRELERLVKRERAAVARIEAECQG